MDKEQIKKNVEFLMKELPGMEIPGVAKVRCKYKKMVDFAKCIGITDKKYIGSEEESIIACPAFANSYTVKAFYTLIPGVKLVQDGVKRDLALIPTKLLHTSNKYNWENCVPIKPGDVLIAKGRFGKVWVHEESMRLFVEMLLTVKNQNDELVCQITSGAAIAAGGY